MAQISIIIDQLPAWVLAAIGLIFINLITFAAFGFDKRFARRKAGRIAESRLLLLIAIGGGIGAFAGQKIFHHKTQKQPFKRQMWMIIAIQTIVLLIVYFA